MQFCLPLKRKVKQGCWQYPCPPRSLACLLGRLLACLLVCRLACLPLVCSLDLLTLPCLYEEGEQIPSELKVVDCPECGRTFTLPEHIPFTDELVCSDCHKGFETWQGVKGASKEANEYQKGASGTILRKKNKQVPEN